MGVSKTCQARKITVCFSHHTVPSGQRFLWCKQTKKTHPDQVLSLKCDRGVNMQNACLGLDVRILSTPEAPLVLHISHFSPTRSLTECHPSHLPSSTTMAIAQTGEPTLLPLLCPSAPLFCSSLLSSSERCGVRAAPESLVGWTHVFGSQIPIVITIGWHGVTLCDAHVGTVVFAIRSFTSIQSITKSY